MYARQGFIMYIQGTTTSKMKRTKVETLGAKRALWRSCVSVSRRRSPFLSVTQASCICGWRALERWTAHTSLHFALSGLVDVSHADIDFRYSLCRPHASKSCACSAKTLT